MTNRKLHARFRLVPKSTTLDDLERPFALCFKLHAFSEPTTKIWMKIDLHCRQPNDSSFWQYNVYADCRYLRGFLGEWASNNSGVIENVVFQCFRTLRLRNLRKWSQRCFIVLCSRSSPFHWPQNKIWPWMAILR